MLCKICKKRPVASGCLRCRHCLDLQVARTARYNQTAKGKAARIRANRKYFRTEKGKRVKAKSQRKNYLRDPARRRAVSKLCYEVRMGRVIRPRACERCGVTCKPHGHHSDYSRPLDVEWLCKSCHDAEHWR